jgi:vitamin B12 transporter
VFIHSLLGTRALLALVCGVCVAVPMAHAESVAADADPLAQILVTANRIEQRSADVLASTTAYTREDIERLQVTSLQDLLRGDLGMTLGNSGGPGKLTSLFMRGTESDHVLVLIDGIKVGSATSGTTPFEGLPMSQVERIEIVRGPRSSLYGSEAIGGVIQIFTRRGGGELRPSLSLGGGSYATVSADAALAGGGDRAWFSLRGNDLHTDGFNACRGSSALIAGCYTEQPDNDAYDNWGASLRAGTHLGDSAEIEGFWLRSSSDVDYDGDYQNRSKTRQQVLGGRASWDLLPRVSLSLSLGRSWDDSRDFRDHTFVGDFETERDSASLQAAFRLSPGHSLQLGADYLQDKVAGTTDFTVDSRANTGVFAQYLGTVGRLYVEASLRHDDNEQFGTRMTGGGALGFRLSPALEFYAQYGTAFKAPSFNDLYYPFFSNPGLRPERSHSTELGARGRSGALSWGLNTYETRVTDLIGFDSAFNIRNIDLARIRGVEASGAVSVDRWRLGVKATWLDPENRTPGADYGNVLPRRVERTGRIDGDYLASRWSAGVSLIAEGERYDDAANTLRLGGYGTVDLRAEWRVGAAWCVQARIANLFDKSYETVAFYPQAGRAAYLTVRYDAARP